MKRLVLMNIPAWISAMRKNTNCAVVLLVLAVVTAGCTKTIPVNDENGDEPQISNVNFTLCQQTKAKSAELSGSVDVAFTNEGVQITYTDFEVTCDFTTVNVTFTFENGFLNITQKGSPNQAKCVCYTDVSYTINGILQNEVNVIFINGVQVYCYNGKNEDLTGFYTGSVNIYGIETFAPIWVNLELKDNSRYVFYNLIEYRMPSVGSYSIDNGKIIFRDDNISSLGDVADLMLTAWILQGGYDYTFDGKMLIFSNDLATYYLEKKDEVISNCDKDVIIGKTEYENAPNANVEIIDMKIVDNCLKMKIAASSWCGSRDRVNLIDTGEVTYIIAAASFPPLHYRTLRLSRESDACASAVAIEVSFNIEDLQIRGDHSVILHISGKTILYEY